jgi:hypothetical protein
MMDESLKGALTYLQSTEGVVISGNPYDNVASRVAAFRRNFPLENWRIRTSLEYDGDVVRCHARIQHRLPCVAVEMEGTGYARTSWQTISEGHAEEIRGKGAVNTTSAAENCETSAVGRALAFLGIGGSEVCSAEELGIALEPSKEFLKLMDCTDREHFLKEWHKVTKAARKRITEDEMKKLADKFPAEEE